MRGEERRPMKARSELANLVVEFIGVFTLVFAGAGAIIATKGENLVAIALAHGLAIGLMVAAAGHVSGGVFNPAIALAAVKLGTPLPGAGFSAGQALLAEIVLTFFLMFVIFGVAIDKRGPATIAGLAIGLTIAMDIFAGGAVSGAAMN